MKSKYLTTLVLSSITFQAEARVLMQKPSYYDHPQKIVQIQTQKNETHQIKNRQQFDLFARNYGDLPHILFMIERKTGKISYINTPKFNLHENYLRQIKKLSPSKADLRSYYTSPKRDFIFGVIGFYENNQQFMYEFWEGDKITPELLKLTQNAIKESFFASISLKTNSVWHEMVAKQAALPFTTQESLIQNMPYLALNEGSAVGILRVIEQENDIYAVGANDIILLKDTPLSIPPVAAVINERPSTALSHVNVLSKSWGIPNIYLKDAEKILAPYIGKTISINAKSKQYDIKLSRAKQMHQTTHVHDVPQPNKTDFSLRGLADLRRADSLYCGTKAANLGEMKAKLPDSIIPGGFCIPFAYYVDFMNQLGIDEHYLQNMEQSFAGDNAKRRAGLLALQQKILDAKIPNDWAQKWISQWHKQMNGVGVFVRSSSNAEDLPHFSGAGLYTTVPNVKSEEDLVQAVKQSWASVFNYSAYEARRVAGLPSSSVNMSVLVQAAVNADLSGVLVTVNPYDKNHKNVSYIAAKRGIGIRVVEGKRIAEQIIYNHQIDSISLVSQSNENIALQLDERGGVMVVPIAQNQRVMTDMQIKKLAEMGLKIKKLFNNKEQDIEWAFVGDDLIILQARPYIMR